jgi:antitoxin HigA-1
MPKRKPDSVYMPEGGWNIQRVTTHPGEMLREEFMKPLDLSANKLALDLHVPVTRITEILHERRNVTVDTALRLGRYFGMSADFWMNLQKSYDLSKARLETAKRIQAEVRPRRVA